MPAHARVLIEGDAVIEAQDAEAPVPWWSFGKTIIAATALRLAELGRQNLDDDASGYSLRQDGGLKVLNRGYKDTDAKWKEAEGKAYFVDKKDVGYLKVSFFGPFYGSYIVFDLDQQDYSYSMISGPDKSYLWLLSRTPTMDAGLQQRLIEKARGLGFDTSKLIYVKQN